MVFGKSSRIFDLWQSTEQYCVVWQRAHLLMGVVRWQITQPEKLGGWTWLRPDMVKVGWREFGNRSGLNTFIVFLSSILSAA